MEMSGMGRMNRRLAVGAGLAGAAGLAWPRAQSRGRAIIQRGIVGGGVVQFAPAEASFSVFASRLIVDSEEPGAIMGRVRWVDTTSGLVMNSVQILAYEDLETPPGGAEARRLVGIMSLGGSDEYPFTLDVIDAGDPGSGLDSLFLTVGDGALTGENGTPAAGLGFTYEAAGPVVAGDIEDLEFEIIEDGGQLTVATPVA